MENREFLFSLVFGHPGRDSEEEWHRIEPCFIEYWKLAAVPLRSRTYEHLGCTVKVDIDWSVYGRRIIRDFNAMSKIRNGKQDNTDLYAKILRPLRLKALCVISGSNKLSGYDWYPIFFLEYYLYEVFFISNLACPGSANFYNISIEGSATKTENLNRVSLSNFYFDEWMIESIRGVKPSAHLLNPAIAAKWFFEVNPHVTQQAENGTQRALFALFHLCKNDGHIDFVMWLFSALESLLATRVGENFSGLIRRAALVLELNSTETSAMSKRMRKLYDLRSAFVHGGFDIAHPIHSESIDWRLDKQYGNVLECSKYGFFLLTAILQKMIETQRKELVFEERLVEMDASP